MWALFLHLILIVFQLGFLLVFVPSLFIAFPVPLFSWTPACIAVLVFVVTGNNVFTCLLNGFKRDFASEVDDPNWEKHDDEKWIFVNGVAVGSHWMQSNLDRLALTFRRPICGIHNRTRGIIFDVIEVIIQRTFNYMTPDAREVYAKIRHHIEERESNNKAKWKKIILILHSQGAVEGGLVLDWLFATVSQELLEGIEVYTFGSAANHFNSPTMRNGGRIIRHIEHYANMGDYVSRFGILNFRSLPWKTKINNKVSRTLVQKQKGQYVGKLFVRQQSGHQLNGNYLDNLFEMDENCDGQLTVVKEDNEYMSANVDEFLWQNYDALGRLDDRTIWDATGQWGANVQNGSSVRIKEHSRLWLYRNGLSPAD